MQLWLGGGPRGQPEGPELLCPGSTVQWRGCLEHEGLRGRGLFKTGIPMTREEKQKPKRTRALGSWEAEIPVRKGMLLSPGKGKELGERTYRVLAQRHGQTKCRKKL